MMNSYIRNALVALLFLSTLGLAGCGGGSAKGTTTTVSGGTPTPATASLSVTVTDPTSGAARTSITLGSPAKANATVLDTSGKAVANTVVSFTITPAGLASMTPSTGTALTNASGVASIQIDPASLTAAGAATITATAAVGTASISGSLGFSISPVAAGLSGLAAVGQPTPLSAYGTTSVTVTITGVPTTTPVTVNFSSLCAGSGKAILPASVQSVNGVATVTYKDNGCGQTDTITASIAGTSVTATTNLLVNSPGVGSIQFVSATPSTIVLQGTGGSGLSASSVLVFKVLDGNNGAKANILVNFALTTSTGGITLSTNSGTTGADGTVQVSVNAGTFPTAVWVTATVANTTFTTQSTMLRISTGRPSQDRFSLSVGTHNIEGLNFDGVITPVNIIASDRLGNPVPDGTAVNFISEGGQIQPSCTTTGGGCSVNFTSASPRPIGDSEPSAYAVTAGRVTVLAYALGEETFTDLNVPPNNTYDAGEPFNDLGDAFLDSNENHVWDAGEQIIPFNIANVSACVDPLTHSPYAPSKAGSCDAVWGPAHVRRDDVIVMSGSAAFINKTAPLPGYTKSLAYDMGGACSATIGFYLYDINRNPLPAGTVLAVGNLSTNISTAIVLPGGVPDSNAPGGTLHTISITASSTYCAPPLSGSGSFVLTVTTPKGVVTSIPLIVAP